MQKEMQRDLHLYPMDDREEIRKRWKASVQVYGVKQTTACPPERKILRKLVILWVGDLTM